MEMFVFTKNSILIVIIIICCSCANEDSELIQQELAQQDVNWWGEDRWESGGLVMPTVISSRDQMVIELVDRPYGVVRILIGEDWAWATIEHEKYIYGYSFPNIEQRTSIPDIDPLLNSRTIYVEKIKKN
jgi:hypothetical protein